MTNVAIMSDYKLMLRQTPVLSNKWTIPAGKGHNLFLLINCKLQANFIAKWQILYMGCPLRRESINKVSVSVYGRVSTYVREHVNTEFDWEVKRGIENSVHK